MATAVQRAMAIVGAMVNRDVTVAEVIENGRALALRDNILAQYDAMTNAQKAEYFVRQCRRWIIPYRRELAVQTLVKEATVTAATNSDAEFAESP